MDDPIVFCTGGLEAVPSYQSEGASGADIRARLDADLVLAPGARALVPTGLRLQIPRGLEAQVRPRSGLASRHGVSILNAPGTIDSDYRGEVQVLLVNMGQEEYRIRSGDRIAQLVFSHVVRVSFRSQPQIDETSRGGRRIWLDGHLKAARSRARESGLPPRRFSWPFLSRCRRRRRWQKLHSCF